MGSDSFGTRFGVGGQKYRQNGFFYFFFKKMFLPILWIFDMM